MPEKDIAEELREVLRLHALHMKSIMDRSVTSATIGVTTPAMASELVAPTKPVTKFSKLMRAAM